MQQIQGPKLLQIDLSDKSQDEINEYLKLLLTVRYKMHRLGHKIKIERSSHPIKTKTFQA